MTKPIERLGMKKAPHVVFKQSPLVLALCQIRYSTVAAVADDALVARFQRAIQNEYPIAERNDNLELSVEMGFGDPEFRKERSLRWKFTDRDENWTVVLAQNFIALETRAYDEFEDFVTRLQQILNALMQHIRPSAGLRIGLRYINEFRRDDQKWDSVIQSKILGPLTYQPFAEFATLAVQQLRLAIPEGDNITVRHGVLPAGSTVQQRIGEEVPDGPFYVLDFDMFREFSPPNILSMKTGQICDYARAYNTAIYQLFRWFVTDEFISTLEVKRSDD